MLHIMHLQVNDAIEFLHCMPENAPHDIGFANVFYNVFQSC